MMFMISELWYGAWIHFWESPMRPCSPTPVLKHQKGYAGHFSPAVWLNASVSSNAVSGSAENLWKVSIRLTWPRVAVNSDADVPSLPRRMLSDRTTPKSNQIYICLYTLGRPADRIMFFSCKMDRIWKISTHALEGCWDPKRKEHGRGIRCSPSCHVAASVAVGGLKTHTIKVYLCWFQPWFCSSGGHPAQLVSTLKSVRHTLRHMFFAVKMQSLHCNMRMFFSDTSHTIIPYFHGGQYELRFQWSTRRRHEPFCLQPCTAAASRCFRPAKSDCEYSWR